MTITQQHGYIAPPRTGPTQAKNLSPDDLARMLSGGSESSTGVYVNAESAMRCTTVYSCVRVLAESIAQLPMHVYREDEQGNKLRDKTNPLHWLFNYKPNSWQTAQEFREMGMGHLCLRGNFYAFKNRLSNGKLAELIPLHPDRVTVKQNRDWSLTYTYTQPDGRQVTYSQEQVMHIRGLTLDGVEGVSPMRYLREAIGLALATEKHGGVMFKNGTRLSGYLKHPMTLGPEVAKRLRENWTEQYAGLDNSMKTPVLEEGMDFVKLGMTSEDAQFLETRKFQRVEICGIFRVPPHMVGDLERATFSNIEHQALEFVTHTLTPWARRWEQVINRDLIPEAQWGSLYIEHLFAAMLRGDLKSRYEAYARAIAAGWMNRNEPRAMENMNKAEGLDDFLTPLNMIPDDQRPTDPNANPE